MTNDEFPNRRISAEPSLVASAFRAAKEELEVTPPRKASWKDVFSWSSVRRVCFKCEGLTASDGIYVFTSQRPESYAIPTEARGGAELWAEILRRGLFDPALAIRTASSVEGLFCSPSGNN